MTSRRRQPRSLLGRVISVVFGLACVWAAGLVWYASTLPDAVNDKTSHTDAIVVLTGGSGRLDIGFELLAEDRARKLFISGVFPGTDIRQLLKMVRRNPDYLADKVAIGTAINTTGNALETAVWMRKQGFTSLRLVTSGYHMPRSLLEFRHALPEAVLIPHPVFPEHVKQDRWWVWPGTTSLIVGEYNKYILVWLRLAARPLRAEKEDPDSPS